jgi:hypothetical protein
VSEHVSRGDRQLSTERLVRSSSFGLDYHSADRPAMSAILTLVIWSRNSLTCTCVYLAVGRQSKHISDPHGTLTLSMYITSIQEAGADIGADFATERAKSWHVERVHVHVLPSNDSLIDYR